MGVRNRVRSSLTPGRELLVDHFKSDQKCLLDSIAPEVFRRQLILPVGLLKLSDVFRHSRNRKKSRCSLCSGRLHEPGALLPLRQFFPSALHGLLVLVVVEAG